uniref:Uncharacterized protein n=1 Tax=Arundo donax TaxID=35708 RepID=A0A0A8YVQ9_ARUDO
MFNRFIKLTHFLLFPLRKDIRAVVCT